MVYTEGYLKEKLTKELDAVHVYRCAMAKRSRKIHITKDALLPGMFFACLVRWLVAAYPYSGQSQPPMYGDYEAQRHWQEITLHTPVAFWYRNTSQNDLQYWGLDYPPLSAYHSLLMGLVADWLDPESVRLFASRGYESDDHKTFMRWTVFLSDFYFYINAVLLLCIDAEHNRPKDQRNVFKRTDVATAIFLLYPGLILIDHGHFQYNCVSLGVFLWATFFIISIENDILATILFVIALNYKQMELYHALPFFVYLLRKCFINLPPKNKVSHVVSKFNKLSIAVITIFIIIWLPFTGSLTTMSQVVHRIFPLKRGVFEDKVSNVWCFINVFVKLKNSYSHQEMAKLCLFTTTLAALPSCIDLYFRINKKKFLLSLINVSLAFFLFSFQVHEKSILLVAVPVAAYFSEDPFMCFWFLLVSNFSMFPLLLKDKLVIPFVATNLIYIAVFSLCVSLGDPKAGFFSFFNANKVYKIIQPNMAPKHRLYNVLSAKFCLSCLSMFWMMVGAVFVPPPARYPDLFSLMISVYSCCHFLMFLVYFNHKQFSIPKCLPGAIKPSNK